MKTINLLFINITAIISSFCFGQEQNRTVGDEIGRFIDKENIHLLEFVQANTLIERTQERFNNKNEVFISQVGVNNTAITFVSSSDADVKLEQSGFGNSINLDLAARSIKYRVVQTGNGNDHTQSVFDPFEVVNVNLVQKGNNHRFTSFGSNSIGNNLKFEMSGESQNIIVRNFK